MSCRSSPTEDSNPEYSIHFPQPVDTEGNVIVTLDEETETVSMPLWYWLKIVNYAIWTDGKE